MDKVTGVGVSMTRSMGRSYALGMRVYGRLSNAWYRWSTKPKRGEQVK